MWPTAHTQVPTRGVEGQLASHLHEEQLQTQNQQQQLEKCMVGRSASDSDQKFAAQVGEAQLFKVTLHRENGLLGFKVVGGQCDQMCPGGIFVSHVTAGGPADREDGLQVQDRLLKVSQPLRSDQGLNVLLLRSMLFKAGNVKQEMVCYAPACHHAC
ncbi:hypothetical protein SRHO_G00091850 [Serrasalmus rhombeus]